MTLTVGTPDVGANELRPPEGGDDATPTWARGLEVPGAIVPEAAPTQPRQPSGGILYGAVPPASTWRVTPVT
jgi:hypothetical protein